MCIQCLHYTNHKFYLMPTTSVSISHSRIDTVSDCDDQFWFQNETRTHIIYPSVYNLLALHKHIVTCTACLIWCNLWKLTERNELRAVYHSEDRHSVVGNQAIPVAAAKLWNKLLDDVNDCLSTPVQICLLFNSFSDISWLKTSRNFQQLQY